MLLRVVLIFAGEAAAAGAGRERRPRAGTSGGARQGLGPGQGRTCVPPQRQGVLELEAFIWVGNI